MYWHEKQLILEVQGSNPIADGFRDWGKKHIYNILNILNICHIG